MHAKKTALPHLTDADPDQLLTIDQVRHALAISEWLARALVTRRQLRAVRLAGMIRVRVADLRNYIAALPEI